MKRMIIAIMLLGLTLPAFASQVIPPRMVVEWLIKAVQEGKNEVVASCFKFDKEKHGKLSPLSQDEQLQLLKDLPLDKIAFEKDKYAVDEGKRFVVKLVAPKKLEFEIEYVELKGELGPPWKYDILAIRETKTYYETSTPRTLSEWKDSQDGKVSVSFSVDKTTFSAKETITVRCAIRNLSDKPLTILRPFGDSFYVLSAGIAILGPDGAIPYRGAMKEYALGTSSFLDLPGHTVVDETCVLPMDVFPGLGKPGLYSIGYQYMSEGYPKNPPPANFWRGQIKAATLTILVK